MEAVSNWKKHPILCAICLSYTLALIFSIWLLLAQAIPSGGTSPKGFCHYVDGSSGLLPLNPKEPPSVMSCNPDLSVLFESTTLVAIILGTPTAIVIGLIAFMAMRLAGVQRDWRKKDDA